VSHFVNRAVAFCITVLRAASSKQYVREREREREPNSIVTSQVTHKVT